MEKGLLLIISVLFIFGCKEDPQGPPAKSKQSDLELRMTGGSASGAVTFLLSTEFRKISIEIERLQAQAMLNDNHNYVSIDSTGTALSSRLFMESDPEKIIDRLNNCFFSQMGISVEKRKETIANSLPDRIYELKKANVAGACLLMLLLGEKADIPLVMVKVKNHYFVRFDNGKVKRNIELLKGGAMYTDAWYISNYGSEESSTTSLQPLTSQEVTGVLYYEASCALQDSNPDFAITGFAKSLEKFKNFREAQYQLDRLIDNAGDFKKTLTKIIELRISNPDLGSLDRSLALLYFRTNNYKSAAEYYERALERLPDDLVLIKGVGISYLNLHEYENAKKYLTIASAAAPTDTQVINWLAQCP